jgi:hypothetical protein
MAGIVGRAAAAKAALLIHESASNLLTTTISLLQNTDQDKVEPLRMFV